MKTLSMFAVTGILALAAVPAAAQTKTLTGETKTVTASVEAIEKSTREVTVKRPDGTYDIFYFPESIKRFDTLKVGDKITAKYYENIVMRLKAPSEKNVDSASGALVRSESRPAGTLSRQRTITALITAIDQAVPSITFAGPNGWKYSGRVEDKTALAKVKVGDRLDITWTEALILSVE